MARGSSGDQETEINAITLHCGDMARSVAFYDALGFEPVFGGEVGTFTTLQVATADQPRQGGRAVNYVNLQLVEGFAQPEGSWGRVIFHVRSPDAIFERIVASGGSPEFPPRNAAWGERYFHVRDPDGHELSFARLLEPDEDVDDE